MRQRMETGSRTVDNKERESGYSQERRSRSQIDRTPLRDDDIGARFDSQRQEGLRKKVSKMSDATGEGKALKDDM